MDADYDGEAVSLRDVLDSGESVVAEWSGRGGKTVLTNFRLLVFSPRHPLHRRLLVDKQLEQIESLQVMSRDSPGFRITYRSFWGGGSLDETGRGTLYAVLVDEVPVYAGNPEPCAEVQRSIDDARTARCISLFGSLRPYSPRVRAPDDGPPKMASSPGPRARQLPAPFVLFLAGAPFADSVPMARTPISAGVFTGAGPLLSTSAGGHIAADSEPGQLYGKQAEMGRLVLDLAQKCGVSVKVVDVEHLGSDGALAQQWLVESDSLPVLVREDGARLSGEEDFVPRRVVQFLQRA